MRYYVDTEFNGNGGQLISLALVAEDGREFYEILHLHELPQPWIKEHVLPVVGQFAPVDRATLSKKMRKFLEKDTGVVTFVGDWPEDIVHVCNMLLRDHGKRNPPVRFRCVVLDLPGFNTADHSEFPHNALADARALKEFVEGSYLHAEGGMVGEDIALLQGT